MFTRGLPASGKTTWARSVDAEAFKMGQPVKMVSLDDLRAMVDGGRYTPRNENLLRHIQDEIIVGAVDAGTDVIVHNTHGFAKGPNRARRLVATEATVAVVDFTDVPIETCKARDADRQARVGDEVIDRIAGHMKQGARGFAGWDVLTPAVAETELFSRTPARTGIGQVVIDPALPWTAIVDLDGTLAIHRGRGPYEAEKCETDELAVAVAVAASAFQHAIFLSGRSETHRVETERWIAKVFAHGADEVASMASMARPDLSPRALPQRLAGAPLYMRPAGDARPDSIVKLELFDEHVRGRYNVAAVLDDRASVVRMWRRIGLPVWQVAEGRF